MTDKSNTQFLQSAWKLLRSELVDVEGNQLADPLNNGEGFILYTKDHVSAQLSVAKNLNEEQAKYTTQEYMAYTGAYSFDIEKHIVTHHIKMGNFPDAAGLSLERKVTIIDANHITISNVNPESYTIGTMIYRKLWWERVG